MVSNRTVCLSLLTFRWRGNQGLEDLGHESWRNSLNWNSGIFTALWSWWVWLQLAWAAGEGRVEPNSYSVFCQKSLNAACSNCRWQCEGPKGGTHGTRHSRFAQLRSLQNRLTCMLQEFEIGAQNRYIYRFSIAGHKLIVVGTDGYLTRPQEVDYIFIHTGECTTFSASKKWTGII